MTNFLSILKDFFESIVPKLRAELAFHRNLAKGGTQLDGTPYVNPRTGQPYMATTQLTHVLVGLTALARLLTYLQDQNLLPEVITDSEFRRVCGLFSLHDLHKDEEIKREVESADTSIAPPEMLAIATRVGLTDWLGADDLNGYEYLEAMKHLSHSFHGNRRHCRGEIGYERLYHLVRLADAMASMQSLEEGTVGLHNRIIDFARSLKHLKFYYHKIADYRGLTTNLYHQAIARTLQEKYNLYPLLFFENGTLYIGQSQPHSFERNNFIKLIIEEFNASLQKLGDRQEIEPEYNPKTQRFEKYVFSFCSSNKLLSFLKYNSSRKTKLGWFQAYLEKRIEQTYFKNEFKSVSIFAEKFIIDIVIDSEQEIVIKWDKEQNFASKWDGVSRYLGGVLNLLRDIYLASDENWKTVINWLGGHLGIPLSIRDLVTQHAAIFNKSGTPEFSHILAYHYLHQFNYEGNTVLATSLDAILDTLNSQLLPSIEALDSLDKRQNYVEDELALTLDTLNFLEQYLILSWDVRVVTPIEDILAIVAAKKKSGSHKKICSICNRAIPKEMKAATIKADILEDNLKEFSNRLLPKYSVSSRLWCPQCYLEWMTRKLAGLGYAPGAESNKSARLYCFILPNPVLTPEMLDMLRDRLKPLRDGTAVKVRQYGKGTNTIPQVWLQKGNLTKEGQGADWLETVVTVLSEEATRLANLTAKEGKRIAGERVVSFGIFDDEDWDDADLDPEAEDKFTITNRLPSNFLIVTLEASAYSSGELITRTELWMRGILTALVLQDLLGMRMYLTDKPYLPVAYLEQVTEALDLDGEHPALRSILTLNSKFSSASASNKLKLRGINIDEILVRLCALWIVNENLSSQDSNIARCLAEVNANELAGARFFADYQRHNKSLATPALLLQSCRILLNSFENLHGGNHAMSLNNLAKDIAFQSLDLFLPSTPKDGKGKSNRYETVYRTAITSLKKNAHNRDILEEEMIGHIAGALIKRLERIETGVFVPVTDVKKREAAHKFAQTIVVDLFQKRCAKSFSRLSRVENDLANAVFFYVSENLSDRWAKWKELKAQRENAKNNVPSQKNIKEN